MKRAPVARVRPAELRERIEASLRARSTTHDARVEVHGRDDAWSAMATNNGHMTLTSVVSSASELGALEALAGAIGLNKDGSDPSEELDYLDALLSRQSAILTGVANALRGDPGPLASHSHHDLAERAADVVALLAVTQASLAAASSGRRVTACDEIERFQRENATLRAAYTQDLDGLRAELRRADDERAAWRDLRDAARAYLAARDVVSGLVRERAHERPTAAESWAALDAARTRLAARVGGVAVVTCPACGVDITADLDDDGVYVTRRHSRREPARVGLGEIAWCDGGLVRP